MKEFSYVIKDELGLHARPAGQLAKKAMEFKSDIKLTVRGKTVDAKRIMGVMTLGAKNADELTITCSGADEDAAIEALTKFVTENL